MEELRLSEYDYSADYFDKIATGWNKVSFDLISSFAKEGLKLLSPQKILDIGCGNGIYGPVLHQKGGKLFGIDISHQSIIICKTRDYDHLILCSADSIAYLNDTFDMVFTSEVIEHVENYEDMLVEIYRVLKPGGGMILTTTCYSTSIYQFLLHKNKVITEWWQNLYLYLKGFFNHSARQTFIRKWCFNPLGGHYHGFVPRELRECMERMGFDTVRSDVFYAVNPFPIVDNYCFISVLTSQKSITKKVVLLLLLSIAPLLNAIFKCFNFLGNNLVVIAIKK